MPGVIDDALKVLSGTGPEYRGFLANHGPMAAEALVALNRPDAVLPWTEQYRTYLDASPPPVSPIARDRWREALGDMRRAGDWRLFFQRELEEDSWSAVLKKWSVLLAPGLAGAAAHGFIRTAHATRSMSDGETRLRKDELAEGLAYWAGSYLSLPGEPNGMRHRVRASRAISEVALLPSELQPPPGAITDGLMALERFAPFAGVIDSIDLSGDVSASISDLTGTFARVYLSSACQTSRIIPLVHAVTATSACRLITPHLSPEESAVLLRFAWQTAAAIYSVFGREAELAELEGGVREIEDLTARAVDNGDEHAIKFTEACLREFAVNPDPIYLGAAADVIRRL